MLEKWTTLGWGRLCRVSTGHLGRPALEPGTHAYGPGGIPVKLLHKGSLIPTLILSNKMSVRIPCLPAQSLSHVWLFVTLWSVACQAPPSMGFPRQEYSSGCHFLLQGSSRPRDWTHISCTGRWILYHWATREAPEISHLTPKSWPSALRVPYRFPDLGLRPSHNRGHSFSFFCRYLQPIPELSYLSTQPLTHCFILWFSHFQL